jgi:hypothetical protein
LVEGLAIAGELLDALELAAEHVAIAGEAGGDLIIKLLRGFDHGSCIIAVALTRPVALCAKGSCQVGHTPQRAVQSRNEADRMSASRSFAPTGLDILKGEWRRVL